MPISKADPGALSDGVTRSGEGGYSLIEVLVALAIMATLVAITSVALNKPIQAMAFKRAEADLGDVVLRARNVSMLGPEGADYAAIWDAVRADDVPHDLIFTSGRVGPYGACRASEGEIVMPDDSRHPFEISPVTCQITVRRSA